MQPKTFFSFVTALVACACGGSPPPQTADPGPPNTEMPDPTPAAVAGNDHTVVFWFDDDPALDRVSLLEGCRLWAPTGVICATADTEAGAEIKVLAVHDGCPDSHDGFILGEAVRRTRVINLMVDCFARLARSLGPDGAKHVFAHETGHAIGIWYHVPVDCDQFDVMTVPNGEKVCGKAMMNAYIDPSVDMILRADELAFSVPTEVGAIIGRDKMEACRYRFSGF
jgi:hypothetical protein